MYTRFNNRRAESGENRSSGGPNRVPGPIPTRPDLVQNSPRGPYQELDLIRNSTLSGTRPQQPPKASSISAGGPRRAAFYRTHAAHRRVVTSSRHPATLGIRIDLSIQFIRIVERVQRMKTHPRTAQPRTVQPRTAQPRTSQSRIAARIEEITISRSTTKMTTPPMPPLRPVGR